MNVKKMNPKQIAFAEYFVELGNAEQAAIKAGYSERYARGNAYKLVANSGIKKYIDERMEELQSERVADQQEIMEFLTAVMRGEVTEPVLVMDGVGVQAIAELKPAASVRKAAAVDLGKRYAMWTDKQQTDGSIGINVVVDYGEDGDS